MTSVMTAYVRCPHHMPQISKNKHGERTQKHEERARLTSRVCHKNADKRQERTHVMRRKVGLSGRGRHFLDAGEHTAEALLKVHDTFQPPTPKHKPCVVVG